MAPVASAEDQVAAPIGGSGAAPREIRGALRSPPDSDMHPRPHGRAEKIFAPCTETGTLAIDVLADHQPHVDEYIPQAQLKTRGLNRDPPNRNPGRSSSCPWCN